MARYAIGDVHGCLLTLRKMVEEELAVSKTDLLVLLGDYVDRGPSSKGVLDYIEHLVEDGYRVIPLRGNHDDMLVRARFSERYVSAQLRNGGVETLDSFGVQTHQEIPLLYCDMIDSYPLVHEEPDVVCLHGSYDITAPEPLADYETILWKRLDGDDLDKDGRRIVCGHTPIKLEEMQIRIDDGRKIILDNGCVYHNRAGLGKLAAIDLDSLILSLVDNVDVPQP